MQLIVLGMHRSGTSVLARVLNLMGAYFAPEGMSTGANRENPKGFWERRDVRELNDYVLHGAGCDWNRVAGFDIDAVPEEIAAGFHARASRLVLEMDAHRPWFIKEPRLCLLLPLWRPLFELPVAVHIVRHPLEVAASLRTRNAMPLPAGLALWERYVGSALSAAAGLPSVQVSHRRLMTEPMPEIVRLHAALAKLGMPGLRMPTEQEIAAFIRPELYRERETQGDLVEYADAPQVRLFEKMEQGAADTGFAEGISPTTRQALAAYEATLPPLEAARLQPPPFVSSNDLAWREKLAASERESKLLRETSTKLDGRLERELRETGRLRSELSLRERQIEHANGKIDEFQSELKQRAVRIAALEQESRKLAASLEERDHELKGKQVEIDRLRGEVERISRLQARVATEARGLEGRLATRVREIAGLTGMVVELQRKAERSEAEVSRVRVELQGMRDSHSWRLTAPMRFAMRQLARLVRRGDDSVRSDVELLKGSTLFDESWYLDRYPDVAASGIPAAEHYLGFGAGEGREPGPAFSGRAYLERYPDVAGAGLNPLVHYLRHGKAEGRTGEVSP